MPPFITTSRWHVGKIMRESVILELPKDAPPIADVMVNVFIDTDWQNSLVYSLPDGTQTGDKFLRLQSFGMNGDGIYPQADMPPAQFMLGDDVQVAFTSHRFTNGMLTLEGVITATSTPTQDYILFFHVLDLNGQMVQQSDSLYLADSWVTSALIPQRPIHFTREIALPYAVSMTEYVVKFGAYTLPSGARIPLYDVDGVHLADDMGEWGRVQVIDE